MTEPGTVSPAARRVPRRAPHPTRAERAARGKDARAAVPLDAHAEVDLARRRPDPVALLAGQAETRVPELVPIRYGRMGTSPFAFYRGAALVMAHDLAATPTTSLHAQLCGDAHLSNFGAFGSPERNLLFDLNDFDETSPGPFEWDVKRLAASFEVIGRLNEYKPKQRRAVVVAAVQSYRETMRVFARRTNLEVWYARLDVEQALADNRSLLPIEGAQRTQEALAKARTRDSMTALSKLTTQVDGKPRIVSSPPLVERVEDIFPDHDSDQLVQELRRLLRSYRSTLSPDRRHLLEQYELVDVARKVVGVGSVGTRCWILLLQGVDDADPLFLQAKEAGASVLEEFVGQGRVRHQGERVVTGQRLMQAASDIFLGWQRVTGVDGVNRDFYIRQLRDWKASLPVEDMVPAGATVYARLCGWTLARAHARSGDRVAIASYLGRKDTFDQAVADFAVSYADQTEKDHAALVAAIGSGRLTAIEGL